VSERNVTEIRFLGKKKKKSNRRGQKKVVGFIRNTLVPGA